MAGLFWFRRSRGPVELAVDMAGVRLGERFLQAGVSDPRVFAILARIAGLTGRACAVVDGPEGARLLEAAARKEGVLVEIIVADGIHWPLDNGAFDVAVVDGDALLQGDASARAPRLGEVMRLVRQGGRVLVIRRSPLGIAARLGFARQSAGPSPEASRLLHALEGAGFRPARLLAEREGMTFVEGFRPSS